MEDLPDEENEAEREDRDQETEDDELARIAPEPGEELGPDLHAHREHEQVEESVLANSGIDRLTP